MWLPKEERYLLIVYTVFDPNFNASALTFQIEDLKWVFAKYIGHGDVVNRASELKQKENKPKSKNNNGKNKKVGGNEKSFIVGNNNNNKEFVKKYMSWLRAKSTIESVNNRLRERGLIEFHECGTGFYSVKLKLAGWDLGDKYSSWWSRNVLWFREYKDHWIWIIVSFLGGIVGALLINWLSK